MQKPNVDSLYASLKITNKMWFSKDEEFAFKHDYDGWRCYYVGENIDLKFSAGKAELERSVFKTRQAAVEFVDLVFDKNIQDIGFKRNVGTRYQCPDYDFTISSYDEGWTAYHRKCGIIKDQDNQRRHFASRKQLLQTLVEDYPQYLQ